MDQLFTQLASTDVRARTGAQPLIVTRLPKLNFSTAVVTEAAPTAGTDTTPTTSRLLSQEALTEAARTHTGLMDAIRDEVKKVSDNADNFELNIQVLLTDVEACLNEALESAATQQSVSQLKAIMVQQCQEVLDAAQTRSTAAAVVIKPSTPAEIRAVLAPVARLQSVDYPDWAG